MHTFLLNLSLTLLTLTPSINLGHLEVVAQDGEGINALLREFQLSAHSCNYQKFYTLNKLSKNAGLIKGRKYFLPIQKFTYDNKSIRSTLGITDYQVALKIQTYNEIMLDAGLREKSFLTDKVLWVPHHLLHCATPDLPEEGPAPADDPDASLTGSGKPVNTGKRIFPIFGNELAYTPLISSALKGKIFYLVSGHGGPDPGAIGKRGGATLCEDEYAYDVTLRLCRKLIEHGATAYMIVRDPDDGIRYANNLKCDKDEVVWGDAEIKTSQIPRLKQRTDIINELYDKNRKLGFKDQYVIEIHVDSRSHSEQVDLFFYFQAESTSSKVLAERLHETMRAKYKQHRATGKYHGTVSIRGLYTLREVKPTAVYIELGNIRNAFDQQRIVLGSNRGILADWLLEGLIHNQNLSRQKRF